jgi:hypothetical protein
MYHEKSSARTLLFSFFDGENMRYESEFEIVETINSKITKLLHCYILLYHIEMELEKEESYLKIWDLRANHPINGTEIKNTNPIYNQLELGYVLYTSTGIHPLHLFFFHEISYDLWKGYLLAKGYKKKPYKRTQWYDLLYPLPFYPNLEGYCHAKEPVSSCSIGRIDQTSLDDTMKFSVERASLALHYCYGKVPKAHHNAEEILISTQEACVCVKQRRLKVMS